MECPKPTAAGRSVMDQQGQPVLVQVAKDGDIIYCLNANDTLNATMMTVVKLVYLEHVI